MTIICIKRAEKQLFFSEKRSINLYIQSFDRFVCRDAPVSFVQESAYSRIILIDNSEICILFSEKEKLFSKFMRIPFLSGTLTFRNYRAMMVTNTKGGTHMKDLAQIDKNFSIAEIDGSRFEFRDCRQEPFRIYGLILPNEEDPFFTRLPRKVAQTVNEGVLSLSTRTAGGRIRFRTDSAIIAIRVKLHDIYRGDHFPMTGSAGFDLYADGLYRGTFRPPFDVSDGFDSQVNLHGKGMRDILIHMPLYTGVISLEIGIEPGSQLLPGDEYKYTTPVVYYGSSITQGGCASRPGNCYQNIISRKLNCDHVNLGFSGSALAEDTMVDYMTGLPMSVFVMDYDHNAPTPEYLEATHEKMYRRFRAARPEVPIVFATMPKLYPSPDTQPRRDVIFGTYEKAKAEGDRNVYLVDGMEMMRLLDDDGRAAELSRLVGGADEDGSALEHAHNMLRQAEKRKSELVKNA